MRSPTLFPHGLHRRLQGGGTAGNRHGKGDGHEDGRLVGGIVGNWARWSLRERARAATYHRGRVTQVPVKAASSLGYLLGLLPGFFRGSRRDTSAHRLGHRNRPRPGPFSVSRPRSVCRTWLSLTPHSDAVHCTVPRYLGSVHISPSTVSVQYVVSTQIAECEGSSSTPSLRRGIHSIPESLQHDHKHTTRPWSTRHDST